VKVEVERRDDGFVIRAGDATATWVYERGGKWVCLEKTSQRSQQFGAALGVPTFDADFILDAAFTLGKNMYYLG